MLTVLRRIDAFPVVPEEDLHSAPAGRHDAICSIIGRTGISAAGAIHMPFYALKQLERQVVFVLIVQHPPGPKANFFGGGRPFLRACRTAGLYAGARRSGGLQPGRRRPSRRGQRRNQDQNGESHEHRLSHSGGFFVTRHGLPRSIVTVLRFFGALYSPERSYGWVSSVENTGLQKQQKNGASGVTSANWNRMKHSAIRTEASERRNRHPMQKSVVPICE